MNPKDDDLRRLLRESVDHIEPHDRINEIREATTSGRSPFQKMRSESSGRGESRDRRGFRWASVGALAAAACVVGVAALSFQLTGDDDGENDNPAASSSAATQQSDSAGTATVPVYLTGSTPQGQRLFREFAQVKAAEVGTEAVRRTVTLQTQDPDYATAWPDAGPDLVSVTQTSDGIEIMLDGQPGRPVSMTSEQARLAIQQVVYTAQGALKEPEATIGFVDADGQDLGKLFGVDVSGGVSAAPQSEVLALVNITAPFEGQTITKGKLPASGRASSFEGNVPWEIRRGDRVVREGFATATVDYNGDLTPWQKQIDVSSLKPGRYTFVASTEDPTGGTEGSGPHQDTKTFVIAN